jgi:hypothetical protein
VVNGLILKISEKKMAALTQNTAIHAQKKIITLVFRRKFAKIAENR